MISDDFRLWSLRFGQRLGDVRRSRHLSQSRAAKLVGCHHSTIGHYEQGRLCPTLHAIYDLAGAYRVPMSRFFVRLQQPQRLGRQPAESVAWLWLEEHINAHSEDAPDLRALRQRRGLTQRSVGEAIGVSACTLSRWESGVALPDHAALRSLADALRCSPADVCIGVLATAHHSAQDRCQDEPTLFLG